MLAQIDAELAATARARGCRCGGTLHRASYPRKPRGVPTELLGDDYDRRESFTCAEDGCRTRTTPPVTRFLGRKVYLGAIVVLVTALQQGPTPFGARRLKELFGVSRATLVRWGTWWREAFAASRFWQAARGWLASPVANGELPRALLDCFSGDAHDQLVSILRFLSPITSATADAGERAG